MSGSFSRPPTSRGGPPGGYETFEEADVTGGLEADTRAAPQLPRGEPMYAEARGGVAEARSRRATQIVPAGSVTGRSLTLVIAIMCFLASLTSGTVYMISRSADAWLKDMASEVTVQVEPQEGVDPTKTVAAAVDLLTKEPGVTSVRALSLDDSAALLEPWLGQADVLKTLPVPRLIALEVDRASPPDLDQLRLKLSAGFKGVSLDDHRHWQQQIRTVTRSFALGGLMILLLVAAATVAVIVSATRSAMASNRDIVEVLHFVGATDRFISREFERHFLKLGVKAGCVGAVAAGVLFAVVPGVVELVGGQSVSVAELRQLVGSGTLGPLGYGIMAGVVVVIAALCMVTSRIGVRGILNTQ